MRGGGVAWGWSPSPWDDPEIRGGGGLIKKFLWPFGPQLVTSVLDGRVTRTHELPWISQRFVRFLTKRSQPFISRVNGYPFSMIGHPPNWSNVSPYKHFASSGWVNSGQLKISVAHNSQMCIEKVFILRKEKRSNYSHAITLILLQVFLRHGCPKEVFYSLGLWLSVKRNEMLTSTMVTGVFAE